MNFDKLIYQHTGLKPKGESFNLIKKQRLVNRKIVGECLSVLASENLRKENARLNTKLMSVTMAARGESAGEIVGKVKEKGKEIGATIIKKIKILIEFVVQAIRGMITVEGRAEKAVKALKKVKGNVKEDTSIKVRRSIISTTTFNMKKMYEYYKSVNEDLKSSIHSAENVTDIGLPDISGFENVVKNSDKELIVSGVENVNKLIDAKIESLENIKNISPELKNQEKILKEILVSFNSDNKSKNAEKVFKSINIGKAYGLTLKIAGMDIADAGSIVKALTPKKDLKESLDKAKAKVKEKIKRK